MKRAVLKRACQSWSSSFALPIRNSDIILCTFGLLYHVRTYDQKMTTVYVQYSTVLEVPLYIDCGSIYSIRPNRRASLYCGSSVTTRS